MQQDSLYFLELIHPKGAENLISYAVVIEGNINKEYLELAYGACVRRHAQSCSSYFVLRDDKLFVHVTDTPYSFTAFYDWSDNTDTEDKVTRLLAFLLFLFLLSLPLCFSLLFQVFAGTVTNWL